MAVNLIRSKDFSVRASDDFFFDNNVWFHLYCPIGSTNKIKQEKYGKILESIRLLKRPIFINSLVLSEFANAWLRLEFKLWSKSITHSVDFKKNFVGTQRYRDAVNEIEIAVNMILSLSTRSSDDFPAIDINQLMESFTKRDFNDSYYLQLANRRNLKIVTDDADLFSDNNYNITVITA